MRLRLLLSWLVGTLLPLSLSYGQDVKSRILEDETLSEEVQTRVTMYGLGYSNVFDTYLSPQEYKGMEARILRENIKKTHMMDGGLNRQTLFHASISYTKNRADNNHTMSALASWNYGYLYNLPIGDKLKVMAGGLGDISGGFTYNLRNGNNPASVRASISLDASAMVLYDLQVGKKTIPLRYQLSFPLLGLRFSPHYGQSYYEIFCQDDAKGTIKLTTPFSVPSSMHMLTADIPFGKFTLRCAYVMDLQQSSLSGIRTHHYSHTLMVGVIKQFLRL